MATPDRFQQLEAEYFVLRGKFAVGRISHDQFSAALKDRMIREDGGAYWTIGVESATWFRYDGVRWREARPPGHTSPNAMGPAVQPPPSIRGEPRARQTTPLPVVSNPVAQEPSSQPLAARPPQRATTPRPQAAGPSHPISVPPRAPTTAAPAAGSSSAAHVPAYSSTAAEGPLAHWIAAVRAVGWSGLLPLAFVLIYVLLTRNAMPLVIGVLIAIGVRVLSAPADRMLAPLWPARDRIPRRPRMVLAWVVPLAVSLLITTFLYNLFAWLPLIGPEASVFVFTAAIAATIAFVLVREPTRQPAPQ